MVPDLHSVAADLTASTLDLHRRRSLKPPLSALCWLQSSNTCRGAPRHVASLLCCGSAAAQPSVSRHCGGRRRRRNEEHQEPTPVYQQTPFRSRCGGRHFARMFSVIFVSRGAANLSCSFPFFASARRCRIHLFPYHHQKPSTTLPRPIQLHRLISLAGTPSPIPATGASRCPGSSPSPRRRYGYPPAGPPVLASLHPGTTLLASRSVVIPSEAVALVS
ncbi:uncharacterized protein J3D65DRAFT_397942 [Phyllosticta citribraziliensis]|uniref:Uncharacterized protein n=1 Tax=Phyllosticta citribraziliensis TaxID=989973 RepID=A0ABR1LL93_9PEZI